MLHRTTGLHSLRRRAGPSWQGSFFRQKRQGRCASRQQRFVPTLEVLEDRTLLSGGGFAPTLTSLDPSVTAVGGPTFSLTVSGTKFVPSATVDWNDTEL